MKNIKPLRRILLIAGLEALVSVNAYATKDFKLQGRLGLGAETVQEGEVENQFEMRLGIKTKRRHGARGYLEIRADEGDREVSVQDAFLDWGNEEESSRIRAGRGKKILGWEYDYSTSDRLSINRSLLYDFLANRQLVGRNYFIGYQWTSVRPAPNGTPQGENELPESGSSNLDSSMVNPFIMIDPSERWTLGSSFHYNESRDSAIILSATTSPSPSWRFGGWIEFQWNRGQFSDTTDSFETMFSVLYQESAHRTAVELFFGDDPYRTQVEKYYGGGRNVRAAGAKAEYGLYFGGFNPYTVATLLFKDVDHYGDRTLEVIGGLRYFFSEGLNLAAEYRHNRSTSAYDTTSEPYSYGTFAVLGRYFF